MSEQMELDEAIKYLDWYFECDDGGADKDACKAWEFVKTNRCKHLPVQNIRHTRSLFCWKESEGICPTCGINVKTVIDTVNPTLFCRKCGQPLLWEKWNGESVEEFVKKKHGSIL